MKSYKEVGTGIVIVAALVGQTLCYAHPAFAQEPAPPPQNPAPTAPQYAAPYPAQYFVAPPPPPASRGGIFFNPIGFAVGMASAELAFGLNDALALTLNGSYLNRSAGGIEMTAVGGGVGMLIFPGRRLFEGLYFAPGLQYAQANASDSSGSEASASLVGARGIVGYHWNWHPFALKLGGGVQYYNGSASGDDVEITLNGVGLAIDASIGFTWD